MPRCGICRQTVRSKDLKQIGPGGPVVCKWCREPKEIKVAETKRERKQIASIHIYEVPTRDGATDHEVVVEGNYAGLELKFTTTFDQVREFFTQKRATGQKARLKSV